MTKACAAAERTGDIENADLAEDCAVGQRSEHGHAVVRDDRQLTALDDVQLLPDVALTADLRLPSQRALPLYRGQFSLPIQLRLGG